MGRGRLCGSTVAREGKTVDPLTAGFFGAPTDIHAKSVKFGWTATAPAKLYEAFGKAAEEVEQARRKLALYQEAVKDGTATQKQLDDVQKEVTKTQADLYENLKTSLNPEDFAKLQAAHPEEMAGLAKAEEQQLLAGKLAALATAVEQARINFNDLAQTIDTLRTSIRTLEDTYSGLQASYARAQGHGLEALGIEADTAWRQMTRAIEDVQRFRSNDAAAQAERLGKSPKQLAAEEAGVMNQLATSMKNVVDFATGLQGTEGAEGLAKSIMTAFGPIYAEWGPQLAQTIATSGDVLLKAGGDLQVAGQALLDAAAALAAAAGQLAAGAGGAPPPGGGGTGGISRRCRNAHRNRRPYWRNWQHWRSRSSSSRRCGRCGCGSQYGR